jgi:hypothetical protein
MFLRLNPALLVVTAFCCAAIMATENSVAATKSSDLVTCAVFANTDSVELTSWYSRRPAEYARFGLFLCEARGQSPVLLTLSSHGALTLAFFDVPAAAAAALPSAEPLHSPPVLAQALGLPVEQKWPDLLVELRRKNKLTAVAARSVSKGKPLWIGYVATMESDRPIKTESEIVYSAEMAETEKLMSVPIEKVEGGFNAFLDALPTFATNLLGVFVGAVLSFIFFRQQQGILAKNEEVKLFRQRKLERADDLMKFFQNVYPDFKTEKDDKQGVQQLRKALVSDGVYSILPLDTMDKLNALCDENISSRLTRHKTTLGHLKAFFGRIWSGKDPGRPTRGEMVDDLLRANFPELMV